MIVACIVAIAVFAILSLPGWILASDRKRPLWIWVAAGFSAQAAAILLTALLGLLLPGLPAATALAVALGLSAVAFALRRSSPGLHAPSLELWSLAVPAIAVIVAALITNAAIRVEDGELVVRAWFNSDGFKHMGHVQSLAAFGLPARDIFGGGDRLAYYWFWYVIPAIGTSATGDPARALIAAGLVQTFGFWVLVFGLVRTVGVGAGWAAAITLVAWLSPTPDGLAALSAAHWNLRLAATAIDIESMNDVFLNASSFFRLSLYIPQHQFMIAGLMAWGLLYATEDAPRGGAMACLSVAPLVAAGAISTLLGVGCLGVFGLTQLLDRKTPFLRRAAWVVAVGVLALAVPLAFGIAGPSQGSGLGSPVFADDPAIFSAGLRFLVAIPGLCFIYGFFLIGLIGIVLMWRNGEGKGQAARMRAFATALVVVGFVILLGSTLLDTLRVAKEMQLRASLLGGLGLVLGLARLVPAGAGAARITTLPGIAALIFLLIGLPTPILDAIWHSASSKRWQVRVPKDDLAILAHIRETSAPDTIVLQDPVFPYLSAGAGIWVPVIGGRVVFTSPRATHWRRHEPRTEEAKAFFAGGAPLPAGDYDLIYLSRALEPETFDALKERLSAAPDWQEEKCLPDACVFKRSMAS